MRPGDIRAFVQIGSYHNVSRATPNNKELCVTITDNKRKITYSKFPIYFLCYLTRAGVGMQVYKSRPLLRFYPGSPFSQYYSFSFKHVFSEFAMFEISNESQSHL